MSCTAKYIAQRFGVTGTSLLVSGAGIHPSSGWNERLEIIYEGSTPVLSLVCDPPSGKVNQILTPFTVSIVIMDFSGDEIEVREGGNSIFVKIE